MKTLDRGVMPASPDTPQGDHPYRQPQPPAASTSAPSRTAAASGPIRLLLAAAVAVGVWMAALSVHERRLDRAITALPPTMQHEMYRRTYEELATVCSTQPGLDDHCRDEAELIVRFPQCDGACRTLARRFSPAATK